MDTLVSGLLVSASGCDILEYLLSNLTVDYYKLGRFSAIGTQRENGIAMGVRTTVPLNPEARNLRLSEGDLAGFIDNALAGTNKIRDSIPNIIQAYGAFWAQGPVVDVDKFYPCITATYTRYVLHEWIPNTVGLKHVQPSNAILVVAQVLLVLEIAESQHGWSLTSWNPTNFMLSKYSARRVRYPYPGTPTGEISVDSDLVPFFIPGPEWKHDTKVDQHAVFVQFLDEMSKHPKIRKQVDGLRSLVPDRSEFSYATMLAILIDSYVKDEPMPELLDLNITVRHNLDTTEPEIPGLSEYINNKTPTDIPDTVDRLEDYMANLAYQGLDEQLDTLLQDGDNPQEAQRSVFRLAHMYRKYRLAADVLQRLNGTRTNLSFLAELIARYNQMAQDANLETIAV